MPRPFTIPGAPAGLIEKINARYATIPAGLMMMADDTTPLEGGQPEGEQPEGGSDDFKSEESKRSVLADLATERKARKDLESRFAAVAEAFGVKPVKGASDDDAVAQLTSVVTGMQLDLDVERLARTNRITDEGDIAALRSVSDPEARAKLAARLAPSSEGGEPEVRRTPRPDASQGPKDHSAAQVVAKPGLSRLTAGITNALETMN